MIRVGIEARQRMGESKICNVSKTQKGDGNNEVRRGKSIL